jgi:predicted transcriptional regulator
MVSTTVIRDAVRIVDVLESAKVWLCAEQFQLGLGSRRMYKALRFLQEQGLVVSRITGEGSGRYKEYNLAQPGLKPIVIQGDVTIEGKEAHDVR